MRAAKFIIAGAAWMIIAILMMPPGIPAQDSGQSVQTEKFKQEELTQMLAPIALYPDSLISQILMASTYPLEVVEAERWLRRNTKLKGDELDEALQEKTWDPSIKSLCHFPEILFAMSDKLDQTRKLGDAFLSQQDDVMATIQELRRKAEEQGNLNTTKEQQVIIEREIIRIEPSDPRVLYVPVYDPLYVYGPWWYPAYPPYYWYYPSGYIVSGGFISFAPRIFIGIGVLSWSWFDWHLHYIHIDFHKTRRFHRHHDRRDFDRHKWRHDPVHRKGVAYRDRKTGERFGSRPSRVSPASPETRGYPARDIERRAVEPPRMPTERRKDADRHPKRIEREKIQPAPGQYNPFSGIGNGKFERKASERGVKSRQGGEIRRQGEDTRRKSMGDRDKGGFRGSGKGGGFRR
ncbi:MAG: DUF3300 domain-containing protein [Nitrospirota bacterium]